VVEQYRTYYESEIGIIEIIGTTIGLLQVNFVEKALQSNSEIHPCLKEYVQQIDEYFKGLRKIFTINLEPEGSVFEKRVWNELIKIPYGETASYLNIAEKIGDRNTVRAVGKANGNNKIAIIIPCHRVIGSDGSLTGYGGGLWRKKWLLDHESPLIQRELFS
jgi:methylated-DNA-[protein]-cysteine S-methyltransferase